MTAYLCVDTTGTVVFRNAFWDELNHISTQQVNGTGSVSLNDYFRPEFRFIIKNFPELPPHKRTEVTLKLNEGTKKTFVLGINRTQNHAGQFQFEFFIREKQSTEHKLSLLFEHSGTANAYFDREGRLIFQNQVSAKYLGGTPDDYIGKSIEDIFPIKQARNIRERFRRVLAKKQKSVFESCFSLKGGKKWFKTTYHPVLDEGGEVLGIQFISQDITREKDAEYILLRNTTILEEIQDIANVGYWEYDAAQNKIFWSKKIYEIFYQTADSFNGTYESFLKLVYPEDRMLVDETYKTSIRDKTPYHIEHRVLLPTGEIRFVREKCRHEFNDKGEHQRSVGVVMDITNEKVIKQELVKAREDSLEIQEGLTKIFNSSPSFMLLTDDDANIIMLNESTIGRFGKEDFTANQDKFGKLIHCVGTHNNPKGCGKGTKCRKCTIRNLLNDTFGNQKSFKKIETELDIFDSGTIKQATFLISSSLIKFKGKNLALLTLDDITERKEMEIQLLMSKEKAEESDQLKSAFLANMSHEIRTPMNGIIGFTEMLTRPDIDEGKRKTYAEIVKNSSHQLLSIVNDVLDISRIETGQIEISNERTSLMEILTSLQFQFEPLAIQKKLSFHLVVDEEIKECFLITDKSKIYQILKNLLDNAIKFTRKGEVVLGCQLDNKALVFYVRDTGIGIPAEMHKKVFERFRQLDSRVNREFGGTGLGLSISNSLAGLLGGSINIDSEPDKGAEFQLVFQDPILESKNQSANVTNEHHKTATIEKIPVILIAEDEETNFIYLNEVLNSQNYKVIRATNGIEAVEKYKQFKDSIDLILMDVKMPLLNGLEATERIKKINSKVPIIAQTAYAMSEDRNKALKAGCDEYITKPVRKNDLLATVSKFLMIEK